jgi:hypothetical protein
MTNYIIIVIFLEVLFIYVHSEMFQNKSISTHHNCDPLWHQQWTTINLSPPTMTEDTGEQKRPAQESDDNVVTKRKRQVKIKFIQT